MSESDPLAALKVAFLERAAREAEALEQALAVRDMAAVETLAHGLAGAAGMFGFAAISRDAFAVDGVFAAGALPDDNQVRTLIATIRSTYS